MKIRSILVRREDLRLTRPYTIAFKTIQTVENGIIEMVADNGMRGYGAFNPCYEVVGEHLGDALAALSPERLDQLTGRSLEDIPSLTAGIQRIFRDSPTARTGLEIAMYDLAARARGIPLVDLLGRKIHKMPTSVTIGIKDVPATLEEAREYTGRGFKVLKVKLGISLEEDLERLIRLREEFGDSIGLIIDANQGYNSRQLKRFLAQTARLHIGLIEQPLPAGEEDKMRDLPAALRLQLAADESLIDAGDAAKLAGPPTACGFFNIKLMKCGGISEALKIADIAWQHSIGLMWGCNDESAISITAALHTAFACPHTRFIDLDGSLDLARDVVAGGFILEDGLMSVRESPGLGLIPLD